MNRATGEELQKASGKLASLFTWIFWIGLIVLLAEICYIPLKRIGFAIGTPNLLPRLGEFLDVATGAIPAIALLAALWTARRLFRQFELQGVFAPETGRTLRTLGTWLLVSGLTTLLLTPSPVLTSVENERLPLSTTAMALACVGLAVRLLGRVLAAAEDLKAEHDQIL